MCPTVYVHVSKLGQRRSVQIRLAVAFARSNRVMYTLHTYPSPVKGSRLRSGWHSLRAFKSRRMHTLYKAPVAQWSARPAYTGEVPGSSPGGRTHLCMSIQVRSKEGVSKASAFALHRFESGLIHTHTQAWLPESGRRERT